MRKVAIFVGSLRNGSINQKLARALAKLGHGQFAFNFVQIGDLPMYTQDLEANLPASVIRMKEEVAAADAVLFVTPEHNRSIPAVLKNAIDWGTRPWGQNSWAGKPGSIIGTSPGNVGTAAGQAHLRSVMTVLDVVLLGQPEVYFVTTPGLIDENDDVTNDATRQFLEGYLARFAAWIDQIAQYENKIQKVA
jgi:chromate reductase